MREDQQRAGHVGVEEAKEILSRFNASHFGHRDKDHARYTIPADPRRDDDIRLSRFIAQYALLEELAENIAEGRYGKVEDRRHGLTAYEQARATLAQVRGGT